MKRNLFVALLTMFFSQAALATSDPFELNRQYTGAEATKEVYKAIYQLDSNDPKVIKKALRNIKNLMEDPRLVGRVQVEIIAYAGGTEALMLTSEHEAALRELVSKGVIVAQCLNTLKERKLEKSQFFDFIAFVPSANGELVIRGAEGWVIVKP